MIRINLLQSNAVRKAPRHRAIPIKPLIGLVLFAIVMTSGFFIYQALSVPKDTTIEHKKKVPVFKSEETPFDVVEDIVDDIHGGRFKVKELNRLSSPVHLSPNEKKLYERLFVKNAFDAFNTTIQADMGFNTITIDNEGNFFVYGMTQTLDACNAFREELEKQDCILKVDDLSFKKSFNENKTHFAMKGFLNYNILESFYEVDGTEKDEVLKESPDNVMADLRKMGEARGIRFVKKPEWMAKEDYGAAKKHRVGLQIESTYSGLMKWINEVYEKDCQIGFSRISLTSIGQQKILSSIECFIYARN